MRSCVLLAALVALLATGECQLAFNVDNHGCARGACGWWASLHQPGNFSVDWGGKRRPPGMHRPLLIGCGCFLTLGNFHLLSMQLVWLMPPARRAWMAARRA